MNILFRNIFLTLLFLPAFNALAYGQEVEPRCIDNICIGHTPSDLGEFPVSAVGREMQKNWKEAVSKYPVCYQKYDQVGDFVSNKGRKVKVRFYPYVAKEGQHYRAGEIYTFDVIQLRTDQVREVFESKMTADMKESRYPRPDYYKAVAKNGTALMVDYDGRAIFVKYSAQRPEDNGKYMAQPGCAAATPKF